MVTGLIKSWNEYNLDLSASFSYSRSGTAYGPIASSGLETKYAPDYLDVNPGVIISLETDRSHMNPDPTGSGTITISIPDLSFSYTHTYSGWQSSLAGRVQFLGLELYSGPGYLELRWTDIKLWANGSIVSSYGAGNYISFYVAPAGIPFLGIPADLGSHCASDIMPALGIPSGTFTTVSYDSLDVSSSGTGGWRFTESGTEYTLPVKLDILGAPSLDCSCVAPAFDTVSATSTDNGSVNAEFHLVTQTIDLGTFSCDQCSNGTAIVPAVYHSWKTLAQYTLQDGHVTLIPNLPKSIKRLNNDYAAMIYRGGMPESKRYATSACSHFLDDETSAVNSDTPYPRQSDILSVVGNISHPCEDTLGYQTIAPYGVASQKFTSVLYSTTNVSPGICPIGGGGGSIIPCYPTTNSACMSTIVSSFVGSESRYENHTMLPYLEHESSYYSSLARYVNYWANPHWSYFYYFPPDDVGTPFCWTLDGAPANPSEYWLPARSQHLTNGALPPGENRKTRTDLISAPLLEGGHSAWIQGTAFGQYTSWWGINKFKTQTLPLTDTTYTQSASGLFTCYGGSMAFDSSHILVTPASGWVVVDLNIGDFLTGPCMKPHTAYKWRLGYTANNISSSKFELIGYDGAPNTLNVGTSGTVSSTYDWPNPASAFNYGGDWGQDFGVNYTSNDVGSDTKSEGISSTLMTRPENVYALELLPAYTADRVRFTFQIAASGTIQINYPVAVVPTTKPSFFFENGQTGVLLHDRSNGIRWGQWNQWDYLSDVWLDTPQVLEFGSKTTTLDWLAYKRMVLSGTPAALNIDSELASLYTAHEGQTRFDAAYDTTSHVQLVGDNLTGFFTNTLAELPPLCTFPLHTRDITDFSFKDSFSQESFSAAHEPRYLITPTKSDLFSPSGTQWTTPYAYPVAGWNITSHKHAVDNTEDATFFIQDHNGTDAKNRFAEVSPWHGYFGTLTASATGIESQPFLIQENIGNMHRVCINAPVSGSIVYRRAESTLPLPSYAISTTIPGSGDASWPKMDLDLVTRRIWLLFLRGTNLNSQYSDDGGETWSTPTVIATGASYPTIAQNVKGDMVQAWVEGGVIHLRTRMVGEQNFASPITTSISSNGFHIHGGFDNQDRWWISCINANTVHTYFSTDDCETWTEYGTAYSTGSNMFEARMAVSKYNEIIRAWRNNDNTLSAQLFVDTAWGAAFNLVDSSGNNIIVGTNGWGMLNWAYDNQHKLTMTLLMSGDTKVSDWWSTDDAQSWTKV